MKERTHRAAVRGDDRAALSLATVRIVRELIAINTDSYNGFRLAAARNMGTPLPALFLELARERFRQAAVLKRLIALRHEEPLTENCVNDTIQRPIMDWSESESGGVLALLRKAERGEDYIKAKYEAVLAQPASRPLASVLQQQYAAVQKAHRRVRALRCTQANGPQTIAMKGD